MPEFSTVLYQNPAPHIVRIVQNRPEQRNAQDLQLTYDLNAAFNYAVQDDDIKCIILAGEGPHFSAGHDMKGNSGKKIGQDFPVVDTWCGFTCDGQEGHYSYEKEIFIGMTRRWRNLSKPTIAEVQGKCIAGGLMIAWACDLIVAADNAEFMDPVVAMGVCGVEFFAHPWELGPRKAKELLFTADSWDAHEAHRLGMVNQVVPVEQLQQYTLDMAKKIANKPMFALKLTKEAVNMTVDQMGQQTAMDAVFGLHQLCHSHNNQKFGIPIDPSGMPKAGVRKAKKQPQA